MEDSTARAPRTRGSATSLMLVEAADSSSLPKKQMISSSASSKKGKEVVVVVEKLVDLLGFRTEEVVLVYQNKHSTRHKGRKRAKMRRNKAKTHQSVVGVVT
ncbi:hypothetical protein Scep_016623 [Stephania cephalantha]|uniref:Uncharacterized protein n=1 Tax=Stephania cephalantha TaxID=152367 RepID=A0AAP0INV2_9MAGN